MIILFSINVVRTMSCDILKFSLVLIYSIIRLLYLKSLNNIKNKSLYYHESQTVWTDVLSLYLRCSIQFVHRYLLILPTWSVISILLSPRHMRRPLIIW